MIALDELRARGLVVRPARRLWIAQDGVRDEHVLPPQANGGQQSFEILPGLISVKWDAAHFRAEPSGSFRHEERSRANRPVACAEHSTSAAHSGTCVAVASGERQGAECQLLIRDDHLLNCGLNLHLRCRWTRSGGFRCEAAPRNTLVTQT